MPDIEDVDGHTWQDPAYVDRFVSDARSDPVRTARAARERSLLIERIEAVLGTLPPDDRAQILDLGCGWGDLGHTLLQAFPRAHVTLVDGSVPMLEHARRTVAETAARCTLLVADLEDPLPLSLDGPFHVVVSSRALHHLRRERLARLYQELADRMPEGGLWLNLDRLLPDRRARMVDQARRLPGFELGLRILWPRWLHNGSSSQQLDMLQRAGFSARLERAEPDQERRTWLTSAVRTGAAVK